MNHAGAVTGGKASISVVVPTFREVDNLRPLIERLDSVRAGWGRAFELLVIDDDSRDGSEELVRSMAIPWVRFITRTQVRGLSSAVMEGFRQAAHEVIVVMDADLSHPPEVIPQMVARLLGGSEFVIGSRYVAGGSTDAAWGLFRWLNSKIAGWLARPFTRVKDPMAGFFAFRRSALGRLRGRLNPIGYKIGLELIVKAGFEKIDEVPIHFQDRRAGQSKLTFKEQLRYLQHLRRLMIFKYGTWSHLLQFLVVGLSGVGVNLGVLTLALALGAEPALALLSGIGVSVVTNFILNRRFTFSYARRGSLRRQFMGYAMACGIGAVVNYLAALLTLSVAPPAVRQAHLAALVGIVAGTWVNFVLNRFVVFAHRPAAKPAAIGASEAVKPSPGRS